MQEVGHKLGCKSFFKSLRPGWHMAAQNSSFACSQSSFRRFNCQYICREWESSYYMISVGGIEGRSCSGLMVSSGNKDMRETELEAEKDLEEGELEEGEACALLFWNEKNFDPDIDLPHIGDKVQFLLGHFMKDYEDGVLNENSGAKYGGYGSFLPSSELSPSDLSHAWTYQIHQNNNRAIHPYHFPLQKFNQVTPFRSSTMPGQIYASHPVSFPVARAPAWNWNNFLKRDVWLPPYQGTGGFTTTFVTPDRTNNPTEQNSHKVLPRTGSASNLAEKVGGLQNEDSSPSLSEDILLQGTSLSPDTQEAPEETPKSISKIGTSIPPSEKCLLSRSSDDTLCLTESPESDELVSDESPMSILDNRSSFPFSSECFLSPLSDSLLRLTMTPGDGNCESMEFSDASKVDKQNFKDGSPDKIHGDRKVSSGGDVQIDSRIDGRMNADKRPDEMIRFDISEKETTQTLLESYQHLTPDQQHNRLDAHTTSSTWPKEQHPAQCHQDATSPNAENRKEHGSDDAEHSKSNVKRPSDQCKCKVSKKRRSDIMYHANEDYSAENDGIKGKLGSGLINSMLNEKDAERCIEDYSYNKEFSTRKRNVNAVYQSNTGISKEVGQNILPAEGSGHEQQTPAQPNNGSVARDSGSQNPVQNGFSCQSLNVVMKEGNDLEDKADFLKNIGSELERAGFYFQAALRFFKGAFLLESYSIQIARHREITDSMFLYEKAALLWESAANDYEKCNEMMTAAALAYKCMEVAFMRVVFSKAIHVEKDRRELQMGLQNIHPGESPSSSSGSDVDSLYNQGMLDTGVGSRMRGYHAFVARNRPNIERVLDVVEDVHIVFKASKKCQKALAAATESCEESKLAAGICLVQRVINFSFHDVDKLIHLVQLAMDAICH